MIRKSHPIAGRGRATVVAVFCVLLIACVALYPSAPAAVGQDATGGKPDSARRAAGAAAAFLDSLDVTQREKALLEFMSEKKANWSNLPASMVPRNGVKLGDLTKVQRTKAMEVLATVLSKDGYQKVVDIMDGDQQLAEAKGRGKGAKSGKGKGGKGSGGPMFGADLYYLAIFGKPSETEPWMVQFGGHHLGVNVTVIGDNFVVTPTHTGTQPALFERNGKTVRPLGHETDAAFKLVNSLDEKQRAQAIIGDRAQQELLLGPGRDGKSIEPKGIKGSALTPAQQSTLLDLIGAWVNIGESAAAKKRMERIKEKIDETFFAWSGPTEKGVAAYFRVQGPSVVIEYVRRQGGTDHIHTIFRNPEDDYGAGQIKK